MKHSHGFKPNHKMSHGGDLGGDGRKHQRIETMKYAKGGSVSSDRAAIAHQKNVGTKAAITGQMAAKKGMSQQPRRLAKGGSASSDQAAIAHQKNVATKAAITGQMAARKGMNQQTRRFAEGGSTSSMSSQAASSTMTEDQKKAAEKAAKEKEKAAKKTAKDKEKDAKKAAKDKEKTAEKSAKDKEKEAEKAAKDKEKEAEKAAKDKEKAAKKADKNKPKTTTSSTSSTPATTTTSPAANTAASNVSASPTTTSAKASEGISYAYVPNTAAEKLGAAVMGRQLKKGGKVLKKANGGTISGYLSGNTPMPVSPSRPIKPSRPIGGGGAIRPMPVLNPLVPKPNPAYYKKGGKVLKKAGGGMTASKMPVSSFGPRGGRPAPSVRPVKNKA